MVALDPSPNNLTSIPGFLNTSSTFDSNQAMHLVPITTTLENPFRFSYTQSSASSFTTEKRKDLASKKNQLSIPNHKRQPLHGMHTFLALQRERDVHEGENKGYPPLLCRRWRMVAVTWLSRQRKLTQE
jgi:hypothetical protein